VVVRVMLHLGALFGIEAQTYEQRPRNAGVFNCEH
jgi:hypothetical protein